MIYLKDNPVGIDASIDVIQKKLDKKLTWLDFDVYGRLYLNHKENGIVAEAYVGGDEYCEVFVDDNRAKIGFVVGDKREGGMIQTAFVDIVCSADSNRIYNKGSRYDEEAMLEVVKAVYGSSFEVIDVKTGNVDTVFNFMDTRKLRYRDMQPFVNFSIHCKVNYFNNVCKFI
jgi:hypothetical protein